MSKGRSQSTVQAGTPNSQNGDRWGQFKSERAKGGLTWTDAGEGDLHALIAAVTEDGCAVLFGKTSDGGALVLQVMSGASRPKWYAASMAELNEVLEEVTSFAKG